MARDHETHIQVCKHGVSKTYSVVCPDSLTAGGFPCHEVKTRIEHLPVEQNMKNIKILIIEIHIDDRC